MADLQYVCQKLDEISWGGNKTNKQLIQCGSCLEKEKANKNLQAAV